MILFLNSQRIYLKIEMCFTFVLYNKFIMSIPIIRIELKDKGHLESEEAAQIILSEPWEAASDVKAAILRVAAARVGPRSLEKSWSKSFRYRSEETQSYEAGRKLVKESWEKGIAKHSFGTQCTLRHDDIGVWKIGKYLYIVMIQSPKPEDMPPQMTAVAMKLLAL
jgi:hypothetical protein